MADSDFVHYPRGQVGLGAGDLQHCSNAQLVINNGAKLKHTLRRTASGWTKGPKEVTINLTTHVPEDGMEREYVESVSKTTPQNFRFKDPKAVHVVEGVFTSATLDFTQEDGINVTLAGVGKLVD